MANRPKAYGLSAEVEDKILEKYTREDECKVVAWICAMTGISSPLTGGESDPVQPEVVQVWLKDGTVLYKVMQKLQEQLMKKPHDVTKTKMEAIRKNKEMESISFFLKACETYGVGSTDLFQTVDLYEGRNMAQVLQTMTVLSGRSIKKGFNGPCIGVKTADRNVRSHTEEQLRQGRSTIGLQMGTNQVASQQGMTPYGLGRQLTQK